MVEAALTVQDTAAKACKGVTAYLKGVKGMSITNAYLATPGSDILFGPYTSASLTIFAPTDGAWAGAAKALGARPAPP